MNSRKYQENIISRLDGKIVIHARKKRLTCVSTIKTSDTESFLGRNYVFYETNQNNGRKWGRQTDGHTAFFQWTCAVAFHGHLEAYLRLSDVCQILLISLQADRGYGLTWSCAKLQSIIWDKTVIPPLLQLYRVKYWWEIVRYSFCEAKGRAESWFSLPKVLLCTVSRNKTLFMSLSMA